MREWLSGGASPCQGEGRGFDPRLALERKRDIRLDISFFRSSARRSRWRREEGAHSSTLRDAEIYGMILEKQRDCRFLQSRCMKSSFVVVPGSEILIF